MTARVAHSLHLFSKASPVAESRFCCPLFLSGMPARPPLFEELQALATEAKNPHSTHIDTAPVEEILRVINTEDHKVPIAVRRELPYVAEAVKIVVEAFQNDGRLFYVGAGTSGRLGVVDAS